MADCRQMRRKLVTHRTLRISTGELKDIRKEWVTEPCGAPLFNERSKALRKCPSCEGGWTHPNNYPVEDNALAAAKSGGAS